MKLTINEIEWADIVNGRTVYRYIVDLNGHWLLNYVNDYKLDKEEIITKLFPKIEEEILKDPNIQETRYRFDCKSLPSLKSSYEFKLPDTFIKDLQLDKKIERINKDFS
jgi:hypothetical protein